MRTKQLGLFLIAVVTLHWRLWRVLTKPSDNVCARKVTKSAV